MNVKQAIIPSMDPKGHIKGLQKCTDIYDNYGYLYAKVMKDWVRKIIFKYNPKTLLEVGF